MSRTPFHIAPAIWPEEEPSADPLQRDMQHQQESILMPGLPWEQHNPRPSTLSLGAMVTQAAQRVREQP